MRRRIDEPRTVVMRRKSGKSWKQPRVRASADNHSKRKGNWSVKQNARAARNAARADARRRAEEMEEIRVQRGQERAKKQKLKEENRKKSEIVVPVSTKTIKNMTKTELQKVRLTTQEEQDRINEQRRKAQEEVIAQEKLRE